MSRPPMFAHHNRLLALLIVVLGTACAEDAALDPLDLEAAKNCGNGVCGGKETCSSCPVDCGMCGDPDGPDAGVDPTLDAGPDAGPIDTDPAPSCPAGNTGPGTTPNGTVPGALSVPFPTLRNATVEWAITGDANTNGVVSVRFRPQGQTGWRRGMPLRRIPADANEGHTWANRHSGSLFDLAPATTYDVEVFLLDPDGGCELRMTSVETRPVPAPMAGAPVKPATPATLATILSGALPGDIIELGAGSYAGFTVGRDGQPGKPIVLRGLPGAVINGSISLNGRKHVHVTGLTINDRVRLNSTLDIAVTRNVINASGTTGNGIDCYTRCESNYIADNIITGQTAWNEAALGVDGTNLGEGVMVTGPGHVIEHNRITGFRDNISFPGTGQAVDQLSIDILNNDLYTGADDAIEADFCFHNCRIIGNRITNAFVAVSSAPGLGGPTYFIRNVVYNAIRAFKLNRGTIGDVMLHNTVVKSGDALATSASVIFSGQYSRNNVFIGGPGGTFNGYSSGSGRVIYLPFAGPGDYDHDGLGSTTGNFTGTFGAGTFSSLAELKLETTEKHAVQVSLSIFDATVAFPSNPFPAKAVVDLRLEPGGAAIDMGTVIPNVNDGFAGAAPDLGAHELGAAVPTYGPR